MKALQKREKLEKGRDTYYLKKKEMRFREKNWLHVTQSRRGANAKRNVQKRLTIPYVIKLMKNIGKNTSPGRKHFLVIT